MKRCVFIQGGLGNQMFGYAFFLLLKRVYPQTEVSTYFFSNHNDHNGLELPRIFPIQLTEYRRARARLYWKLYYTSLRSTFIGRGCKLMLLFLRYLNLGLCIEPASRHTRAALGSDYIFNKKYKMYLGYWTSEFQRFTSIEDEIRKHFSFKVEMLSPQSTLLWTELKEEPNSVSLHIRRGDYLNNPQLLDICDDTYYCKACSIINKRMKGVRFYVFSDDISWVKQHLSLPESTVYVDWNKKEDAWQDLFLMSHCRHNIIANSTFSWWGAWLNSNPDKTVICPKTYSRTLDTDIMPDKWIKI